MLYDPSKEYNESGHMLLEAAQYIEEHGHCKGKFNDKKGRVCILGAMQTVAWRNPAVYTPIVTMRAFGALKDGHHRNLNNFGGSFVEFNDHRKTTAQEVIDLFRKAAETCKVGAF